MKMFRKYMQKAVTVCAAVATILFAACSDVDSGDDGAASGETVTVRIAVDDGARTALPQFEKEDFTSFKLTWTNSDGTKTKQWIQNGDSNLNAYQMMNNDSFTLTAGTYTFVLTGTDASGTVYKGTLADKTVTQDSVITFSLELLRLSESGYGALSISVTYPTDGVKKIGITRYNSVDEDTYTTAASVKSSDITNITGACSYTENSMSVGGYIIEFVFYGDDNIVLGKWLEYAYVTANKTSKSDITIDALDSIYGITYKDADDATFTEKPLYFTSRGDMVLPTPTKDGATFAGWYTGTETEDGTVTLSATPITGWNAGERSEDITLYAKWTVDTYKVTFYTNVYSDDDCDEEYGTVQTIEYGKVADKPETDPTKHGFTFVRWSESKAEGAEFDFATPITENINLHAVWSYDITFNANAGTDTVTGAMEKQAVYTNYCWRGNRKLTANTFERTGYSFLGWAKNADATKADYADGEDLMYPDEHWTDAPITLYAVWHDDTNGHVVTFDSKGGEVVAAQVVADDGKAVEPDTIYRDDFDFAGWFTSADGGKTLSETAYDFDNTVVTANITLYAAWVHTTFRVSARGSDDAFVDAETAYGDGTAEHPFATVTKAVSTIQTVGSSAYDYFVMVDGEIIENIVISSDSLTANHANSLTIYGITDNSTNILNGNQKGTVLTIQTAVPITLCDITVTNGSTSSSYSGGGITLSTGAELTLSDGVLITGNKHTYSSNYAGGGVFVGGGTLFIEDGAKIANNTSSYYGGGVGLSGSSAKVIMEGGEIAGNTANYGGGVYAYDSATFTMDGGEISGNTARNNGGGVLPEKNAIFTLNAGEISGNTARFGGGGVAVWSTFEMNGGTISNNAVTTSSNGYGGGVYNVGTVTMTGGAITSNTVTASSNGYGGGIYNNGTVTMNGGTVSNNAATASSNGYGGGVYNNGTFNMTGGTISGNTAKTYGGAFFNGWCTFKMSGSAYIPAGEDGKNDVYLQYLSSGINITVTGELTATAPVATITPSSYSDGGNLLYVNGIAMTQDIADKFAVTPYKGVDCAISTNGSSFYAYLALPSYTLTYKDKGGENFSGKFSSTPSTTYTLGSTASLSAPTKDGFVFMGWYIEADCSGSALENLSEQSGDLTLYAYWVEPNVSVTVDNGDISVKKAKDGSTITLTAASGYKDYTWLIDGTAATEVFADSSVSDDGTVFTFSTDVLLADYVYVVRLTAANNNGVPYSTNILIQK